MTPDRALIHSILTGGLKAYNVARRKGIKSKDLFGDDILVFKLIEEFAPKGKIPNLAEVEQFAGVKIAALNETLDVEKTAEAVARRSLIKQLNDGWGPVADLITKDPYQARKLVGDLFQASSTRESLVDSSNSPDVIGEIRDRYLQAKATPDGLLGLSSPWPSLDAASLGLQKGELHVLFAKRKVGKCVTGSTIVHDPVTGRERSIAELVKSGDGFVLTWDENKPVSSTKPSAFIATGSKECLRFTFKSGRSIEVTPEHPFKSASGWRSADSFSVGQHVATVGKLPEPSAPQRLDDAEVIALAHMIAEGGCTNPTSLTFTNFDPTIVEDMQLAIASVGGCKLVETTHRKGSYHVVGNGGPNAMNWLMKEHGLAGKKSVKKTIPQAIFSLPNDQLAMFLGRYWSDDGSVEARGMVSACTGSHTMALQLQHLLLRFGVQVSVRAKAVAEATYYELLIRKETLDNFKAYIGPHLVGPKRERLEPVGFHGLSRIGWIKSEELRDAIYQEIEARPELLEMVGRKLNYSFPFQKGHIFDSKSGRIRRKVFSAFCDVYKSKLAWVLSPDIWWDEIVSIENIGVQEVYDLTVPVSHCFVANDIIVHNTFGALAWVEHIWSHDLQPGESILVISMEMPKWQIYRRLFAIKNRLNYAQFREGRLPEDQEARFFQWCQEMEKQDESRPCIHVASSKEVKNTRDVATLVAQHRPRLVFVDAFYILNKDAKKQKWERTLECAEELKLNIASDLEVPVLASTQLASQVGKQELDADSDGAAFAKNIGDYVDASYGFFADDMMKEQRRRILKVMDAREFVPITLQINFDQATQNYSEIKRIDDDGFKGAAKPVGGSGPKKGLDDLPDFEEGEQLKFGD